MGPGGDVTYPVMLWRDRLGCGQGREINEWSVTQHDVFTRWGWETCESGEVYLDLHARGHFIPRGWIAQQLDELLGLEPPAG